MDVVLEFWWFGCLSSGVVTSEVSFQPDMMRASHHEIHVFAFCAIYTGMDDGVRSIIELPQTAQTGIQR